MHSLRLAFRSFTRSPGFTVIAVVTLALGIGLNTAMFSFVNELLLRPLPFPNTDELVRLYRVTPQNNYGAFSPADYFDLRRGEAGFGRFAGYQTASITLDDSAQPVSQMRVSANFFELLGVKPRLGRAFRPDEELRGKDRVVILSHAFWRDHFDSSRDIIGRTVRLDGETHEIIGVLPPSATDYRLFGPSRLFAPLSFTDKARAGRNSSSIVVLGRRDRAISTAQADAFLSAFAARLEADFPKENADATWRSESLPSSVTGPAGRVLVWMLLGLSGCVLLIACSNLANFLLARSIERSREIAVRAALGASRPDLLWPLAIESLLLAAAGAVGAGIVALCTTEWLGATTASGGGPAFEAPLDWHVLSFMSVVTAFTVVVFSLAPALFTIRIDPNVSLKAGSRGTTASRRHQRFRHALIAGQFALATVLLAGVGFFLRGAANQLKVHHGWDANHVIQGELTLSTDRHPRADDIAAFRRELIQRLEAMPGIESASFSYGLPYLGLRGFDRFVAESGDSTSAAGELPTFLNGVSPSYFKVTGTRLIAGRYFNDDDRASGPKVVIINETMARTLFPGMNPLGRRVSSASSATRAWSEVVGVVEDIHSYDLSQPPRKFQLYQPITQDPQRGGVLAVRISGGTSESAMASIRRTIAALDPELSGHQLMPAQRLLDHPGQQMHLAQTLLGSFALLGLFLAALGIYGVMAHTVMQRTGEIGIRMALGAQGINVVRLVLGTGLRIAAIGAGCGLLGGIALARLLAAALPTMLTDGSPVVVVASLILCVIALLACWLPARRATQVDPMVALRAE